MSNTSPCADLLGAGSEGLPDCFAGVAVTCATSPSSALKAQYRGWAAAARSSRVKCTSTKRRSQPRSASWQTGFTALIRVSFGFLHSKTRTWWIPCYAMWLSLCMTSSKKCPEHFGRPQAPLRAHFVGWTRRWHAIMLLGFYAVGLRCSSSCLNEARLTFRQRQVEKHRRVVHSDGNAGTSS